MRLIVAQTVDHRVAAQGAASNECQVVKWVQRAKKCRSGGRPVASPESVKQMTTK